MATPHLVMASRERYSIGFFYGPSLDASLRPLDLAPHFIAAVKNSNRHRTVGIMPTMAEIENGVNQSLGGAASHATYGDLLWSYFSRAYPDNMALHYPDG